MAEVHLPVVGGVSKKALAIGGAAAAAVVGLIYIRKRKGSAASPAAGAGTADPYPADGTVGDPADPNSTDPATGITYGDEGGSGGLGASLADQLAASGYTDPNTGSFVYGNSGTGQAAATTNQAWAQNAIAYLGSNVSVDSAALSAALGAYLAGQPLTSDQVGLVDQAIAVEGYPPVSGAGGYPPGIREAGTPSQGGTGGSGGGVTGSGSGGTGTGGSGGTGTGGSHPITATVTGLQVSHVYAGAAQVIWHPLSPPAGQGPLTGYGVAAYDSAGRLVNGPFTVTNGQVFANIGGLKSKTRYHVNVWAEPARTGGPHATVSFTTK